MAIHLINIMLAIFVSHLSVSGYILVLQPHLPLQEAEDYCRTNYHSTLASIHSESDWGSSFLAAYGTGSNNKEIRVICWIGLINNMHSPQNWSWTDESVFNFSLWDISHPDNHNCTVIDKVAGYWRNANCSEKKPFLCNDESPTTSKPVNITANYGVVINVTFKYEFDENEQDQISMILQQITTELINETVSKECILSYHNELITQQINKNNETVIFSTISLCDSSSQQQVLVAITDNTAQLQTNLINIIKIQLYIDINSSIIIETDCISTCDSVTTSSISQTDIITTMPFQQHQTAKSTIFLPIIYVTGCVVFCCMISLCLMIYIRYKKQTKIISETITQTGYQINDQSPRSEELSSKHLEFDDFNNSIDIDVIKDKNYNDEPRMSQIEGQCAEGIGDNIITIRNKTPGDNSVITPGDNCNDNRNMNINNDEFIIDGDDSIDQRRYSTAL